MLIFRIILSVMTAAGLFFLSCSGSDGSDGANGYSVLISQTELLPGAECAAGGVQIDAGPDTDGDGVLDAEEITNTEYVCSGESGADGEDGQDLTDIAAGTTEIFTVDGVSFVMKYVPDSIAFPTGTADAGAAAIYGAYWIGETEVTYELWYTVHSWALSNGYAFANPGREGHDGTITTPAGEAPTAASQEPVTTVNWRDAMVWCNALTEWYNAQKGATFTCVYTYAGAVIRDSQDSNATACDSTVAASGTGFRLLSSKEWEMAARWRDDSTNTVAGYSNPWFTQGDSASGATADYSDAAATGLVAVYVANSGSSTAAVKSKLANSLGLYDMSGNVWEWCFDWHTSGSHRVIRGGDWGNIAIIMQAGYVHHSYPYSESSGIGFRFARTQ